MPYRLQPYVTQHWHVVKPAAAGRRGIVAAQAREAAEVGIACLEAGGNAVDAAVATALALAVVEPWNSGLGGVGFALVHPADESHATAVDFGPVAPAGLTPSCFRLTGNAKREVFGWPEVENDANIRGPLSFVTPSAVSGYAAMHARWGQLPLVDVMEGALALARRGLVADWFTTLKVANAASTLRLYPESACIYLPNGLPPTTPYQGAPGVLALGRLADTLDRLAHAGLADFYEGDVAAAIARDAAQMGGVLSRADLAGCVARVRPADQIAWRDCIVQTPGRLTAAPTLAGVLGAMRDVGAAAPDPSWFAALARAMRAAYAERLENLGDAEPQQANSCTTHITVCDEAGAMVAITATLLSSMGSGVVLPSSGILMNNGVMWFDPTSGRPNSIAPGKRPLTNMCPVILRKGGCPTMALGASGGRRIMAAVAQSLLFVEEFGMDPEAAAHHPRIGVSGLDGVTADLRFSTEILDALRADGPVELVEHTVVPTSFACPNMIVRRGSERIGITDAMSPWSAAIAQG